ncbi:hypothetical protein [Leptolyngbya sp. PCC 6406]|uniref:hypothetical protein n=1 Tax=Leptolyngbya sp. PCC 6406 TaxID=1173264 RepID=UPI0002AD0BC6|nr:hypothetical protein [Leptolyngbya sp. PCC 6406]
MTTGFTPSSNQIPGTFANYNKTKLALINDLEKLRSFSKKIELKNSVSLIEKILDRVHDETFSVISHRNKRGLLRMRGKSVK